MQLLSTVSAIKDLNDHGGRLVRYYHPAGHPPWRVRVSSTLDQTHPNFTTDWNVDAESFTWTAAAEEMIINLAPGGVGEHK